MSTHQVPLVNVRIARSPMNIHNKSVPAHEVFILLAMFPDTTITGPVTDARGRVVTRTVDSAAEYERLSRAYGSKADSDTTRCEDVFGPVFGQAWRGALEGGLDNFEIEQPVEAGGETTHSDQRPRVRLEQIVGVIALMESEDPGKANEKFWTTDGRPEVAEIKRRIGFKVSAADRDQAAAMLAGKASASQDGDGPEAGDINVPAVQARLDDLGVAYDPDAPGADLVALLSDATVSGIQALGGEVDPAMDLQGLSEQLDELRTEADAAKASEG